MIIHTLNVLREWFARKTIVNSIFDPTALVDIYSSDKSIISIPSYYDNYKTYITGLDILINKLLADQDIYYNDIPNLKEKVYVTDFFKHKNVYQNPVIAGKQFLESITTFLETIKTLEEKVDPSAHTVRNLRVISGVVSNLKIICEVFSGYTTTIQ